MYKGAGDNFKKAYCLYDRPECMLWTQSILLWRIQWHSPTLSQAYAQHSIGSGGEEEVIASLPSACPNYELARGQLSHQHKLELL